ncbi:DnaJ-domain-containing protein [Hypoxylon sp. EC38]|nr:DnaJ-domain-containing protein [Hypoxylon sp. EC38]
MDLITPGPGCFRLTIVLSCIFIFLHIFILVACPEIPEQTNPQKPNSTKPSTYYDVLGVPLFSSDEVVKSGYHLQAKMRHPDKVIVGNKERATKEMAQLNEAYEFLSSRDRCIYDLKLGSSMDHFIACQDEYYKRDFENFKRKREEERVEREEKLKAEMDSIANKKRRWGKTALDEK